MARLNSMLANLLAPLMAWRERAWRGRSYRILTYHRVCDHRPGDRLCVRTGEFAAQLDFLIARGFEVRPLPELVMAASWPERAVAITFDDGYADNVLQAFPELEKRRLPFTIYITSRWIDQPGPVPGCRNPQGERDRALTADEIRGMVASGLCTIGSHTCSHVRLGRLDETAARRELIESKTALETLLGNPVMQLAYPAGSFTVQTVALAREAGYDAAVTVEPGRNTAQTPRLELRRTEVSGDDTLEDFTNKLGGAFDPLHRFASMIRRMRRGC